MANPSEFAEYNSRLDLNCHSLVKKREGNRPGSSHRPTSSPVLAHPGLPPAMTYYCRGDTVSVSGSLPYGKRRVDGSSGQSDASPGQHAISRPPGERSWDY